MASFEAWIELIGKIIESVGVGVILFGLLIATGRYIQKWHRRSQPGLELYREYRQNLGRAILIGLEILVAGDIIRTVAAEPTLTSVSVLAIIVLIRTFLSMSIEVELEGRWPWRRAAANSDRMAGRG